MIRFMFLELTGHMRQRLSWILYYKYLGWAPNVETRQGLLQKDVTRPDGTVGFFASIGVFIREENVISRLSCALSLNI